MLKKAISILLVAGLFILCCSGYSGCSKKEDGSDSSILENGANNSPYASQSVDNENIGNGEEKNTETDSTTKNTIRQNPGSLKDIIGVTDLSKLPDYLEGSLEKYITIQADIEVYPEQNYSLYKAFLLEPKDICQQWISAFIPGKELTTQNLSEPQNGDYNYQYNYQTIDNEYLILDTHKQQYRDLSSKVTSIYDDNSQPYHYIAFADDMGELTLRERFPKQELENFPKESAIQQVNAKIQALGISNLSQPRVYAMDVDSVNNWVNSIKNDPILSQTGVPASWDRSQECYYIVYDCCVDGVKITHNQIQPPIVTNSYGTKLAVFINQNGIISFEATDFYQANATQQNISIISLENALKQFLENYKNTFAEESKTVTYISLQYVPKETTLSKNEFELHPTWIIAWHNTSDMDTSNDIEQYEYVDAITGKLMTFH